MDGKPPKQRIVMMDTRKTYANNWAVSLTGAPCANPGFCLYAVCCSNCVAYFQRKKIMYGDLTNYTCCNGDTCISGRLGEKSCPEFCLCVEVCCCFPSAVATNRFMIQDEMRVMNTECDNCLIGFMLLMNQLACIFRLAAIISQSDEIEQLADILDCIADLTYCSVCACMQTQHEEQLKVRETSGPSPGGPMQPPPQMQMQAMPPPQGQMYAPQAGYAPQPAVYAQPQPGYPPQGYPPQGYPPQGYPPQGYAQPPPRYS